MSPEDRSDYQNMVRDFHVGIGGCKPDAEFRVKLIQEEAQEFIDAVNLHDVVEVIDALCDLLYVVYGAAEVFLLQLSTAKAEKTTTKTGPDWPTLHSELDDFNLSVSDVVWSLRNFAAWNAKGKLLNELEDFAQGLWQCGAEGVGVDLRPFFKEVHRTNMHKLTGPKREDGKQLKPKDWKPPRIEAMYLRLREGKNPICDAITCISERKVPAFDVAERISHPDGGYHCRNCGGLFVEVENVVQPGS